MIDNLAENYRLQPNNGLLIKTWTEDMKDTHLFDLMKLLKQLYNLQPVDVRVHIKKIKEEIHAKLRNCMNPYSKIEIK